MERKSYIKAPSIDDSEHFLDLIATIKTQNMLGTIFLRT
jgi:hypothetical protein